MRYTPEEPGSQKVLPDGEYQFEVTNAEEKTSESSGNDMIALTLKIKDGGTVYDYLVNVGDALWKLNNFRASIGDDVKPGVSTDVDPDSFIGRRGTCVLYQDEYQGKKKNKVSDYVFVVSGPGAQTVSPPKDKWR